MSLAMQLEWRGGAVMAHMAEAAEIAIERIMNRCVEHAKADHPEYPPASEPWARYAERTGELSESIQIFEKPIVEGTVVAGSWGADMPYAVYLELGTGFGESPAARAEGLASSYTFFHAPSAYGEGGGRMEPRPYLRPAADRYYPELAVEIGIAHRELTGG